MPLTDEEQYFTNNVNERNSSDRDGNQASMSETEEDHDESEEEEYVVEKILKKRANTQGQTQYLIKWAGWPESSNTWEDEDHVFCSELIAEFEMEENERDNEDEEDHEDMPSTSSRSSTDGVYTKYSKGRGSRGNSSSHSLRSSLKDTPRRPRHSYSSKAPSTSSGGSAESPYHSTSEFAVEGGFNEPVEQTANDETDNNGREFSMIGKRTYKRRNSTYRVKRQKSPDESDDEAACSGSEQQQDKLSDDEDFDHIFPSSSSNNSRRPCERASTSSSMENNDCRVLFHRPAHPAWPHSEMQKVESSSEVVSSHSASYLLAQGALQITRTNLHFDFLQGADQTVGNAAVQCPCERRRGAVTEICGMRFSSDEMQPDPMQHLLTHGSSVRAYFDEGTDRYLIDIRPVEEQCEAKYDLGGLPVTLYDLLGYTMEQIEQIEETERTFKRKRIYQQHQSNSDSNKRRRVK